MDLLNTHPIKKSDLGFHGNLFGGKLLAWLDASAAAYSMQVCDTPLMVTIKIDECVFKKSAKEYNYASNCNWPTNKFLQHISNINYFRSYC